MQSGNVGLSTDVLPVMRRGVTQETRKVPSGLPYSQNSRLRIAGVLFMHLFIWSFIHSFIYTEHLLYAWHQATDQDAVYLLMGNKVSMYTHKPPKPHGLRALKGTDTGPRFGYPGRNEPERTGKMQGLVSLQSGEGFKKGSHALTGLA